MLKKAEGLLLKIHKVVFSAIMFIMLAILTYHVTMRYLFNKPLIWTDEVTTILQGTIAFLGIGYCFHRNQHTELALLYDKVPKKVQWLFDIITNSVMLFCLFQLIKVSSQYVVKQNIPLGTISWINKSYFYIFIPIGFMIATGYVCVRLLNVLVDIYKTIKGGDN